MPPTGVVLFNLGGPETLDAVEPFLVRLFSDRELIQLPLGALFQPVFARLIARLRGPAVRRNYARIGGGSPQLRLTNEQGRALESRLNDGAGGDRFRVVVAMRYSDPSSQDALERLDREGVRRIVTLTLFPHYSRATTGSSRNELARRLATAQWRTRSFEVSHIDSYPTDPWYLDAMAATAREAYEAFGEEARARLVILFSAHSLPQRFIDEGDPYVEHIAATRQGVLDRLRVPNRHVLGYQSQTGPVKWLGPRTEELIKELAAEGVRELLIVPLSFVSDHIETLYEIDLLFKGVADARGIREYRRPAALNIHPLFIESLARQVETHLGLERAVPLPAAKDGGPSWP